MASGGWVHDEFLLDRDYSKERYLYEKRQAELAYHQRYGYGGTWYSGISNSTVTYQVPTMTISSGATTTIAEPPRKESSLDKLNKKIESVCRKARG